MKINHSALTQSRRAVLAALTALSLLPAAAVAQSRVTLGWLERVRLEPWGLLAKAKLDTGANTAAINATDIENFERAGNPWVRFTLALRHRGASAPPLRLERPLERQVNIKARGSARVDTRPTVKLEFCLGQERYETLFALVNRSNFNYPILLGRRFLAKVAIIDPAARFTTPPHCPARAGH